MEQTLFVRLSLLQKKRPVRNHREDILIHACFRLLRITYFNTASFTVYLLPTLWRRRKGARHRTVGQNHVRPDDTEHAASPSGGYLPIPSAPHEEHLSHRKDSERTERIDGVTLHHLPSLTVRETAKIAAWWSIVWFIANWAVNASLAWTSVASVTILSSTSGEFHSLFLTFPYGCEWEYEGSSDGQKKIGFFTLALGRICRVESLTSTKLIAVIARYVATPPLIPVSPLLLSSLLSPRVRVRATTLTALPLFPYSFLGVLLVTHSDSLPSTSPPSPSGPSSLSSASSHPIFGDALALTSAAFYAVYVILLKVRVVDEERADMQLMLG